MAADQIFARLNDEQRAAVEATRGCVCILAVAGLADCGKVLAQCPIGNGVLDGSEQFDCSRGLLSPFAT